MTDLLRLPADISPEEFFAEALPAALVETAIPAGACHRRLQVNVVGEHGVEVNVGLDEDGDISISFGQALSPALAITLCESDFRAIVAGQLRARILDAHPEAACGPLQLRRAFVPETWAQALAAFDGDVQVRVEDHDSGAEAVATFTFGGRRPDPSAPRTRILLTLPVLLEVALGRLNPQSALMQGKVRVEGDTEILLGLLALVQGA